MLCGSSPLEASSGRIVRHRLNRGGDRQANAALYRIVLTRLRFDQATKDYVRRRTTEGMSKKDIIALPQAVGGPRDLLGAVPHVQPYRRVVDAVA